MKRSKSILLLSPFLLAGCGNSTPPNPPDCSIVYKECKDTHNHTSFIYPYYIHSLLRSSTGRVSTVSRGGFGAIGHGISSGS